MYNTIRCLSNDVQSVFAKFYTDVDEILDLIWHTHNIADKHVYIC